MKMRLRIINIGVAAVAAVGLLAGCSQSPDPTATPAPEPAAPTATSAPAATPTSAPPAEPLLVAASIYPMQYFAERVGGERVRVVTLVPPGVEAHAFRLAPSDLRVLAESAVIAMNGLEMEPWLERAIEALGDDARAIVVEAADAEAAMPHVEDEHGHEDEDEHGHEDEDEHGHEDEDEHGHDDEDEHGHEDEDEHGHEDEDEHGHEDEDEHGHEDEDEHGHDDEDEHGHEDEDEHGHEDEDEHGHEDEDEHGHDDHAHGEFDPHLWNDPLLAIGQAERIADALIEADPDGADVYRANLAALAADLRDLHAEFQDGLASCRHRQFIASHAAYGYLAARYDIKQVEIAGLSPEAEPTAGRLAELADLIEETGISVVLVEPVLSGANESALAQEAGIRQLPIHAIGSVTPAELERHGDYIGLMRDTLASLRVAMECA